MLRRNVISWTTMINGYAREGIFDDAQELFDLMPKRDAISWNGFNYDRVRLTQTKTVMELRCNRAD